jgi:CheY-like chemotaxis protein/HPt (histidine-containing phosphotransfer) domain-containing protein
MAFNGKSTELFEFKYHMKTVLIIEDDEISQSFMVEAIGLLSVRCITSSSFSEARELCENAYFDLIISDVNTADGSLFEHASCLPKHCKKLAVSAEITASITERLLQLGMHEVMAKPMSVLALHAALNRLLELDSSASAPLWDKQKALLAVAQNESILITLKDMFRVELPLMTAHIQQAFDTHQPEQIHETLHKLKASCGFLGASRLLQECARLDADISAQNIERFMDIAEQTLTLI